MQKGKNDIIKSYDIEYTHRIYENPKCQVSQEEHYMKLKGEILDHLED
jgi:hypothetical protein